VPADPSERPPASRDAEAARQANAALRRIAREEEIARAYPDAVRAEVSRWEEKSGIDDASLTDLTHLPFVTIDAASARDLDQAVFVEKPRGGGWLVRYAIADAAHFVPPGSALFDEALRRGASYYFPGFSVPMLPRELSEGLVSLNPAANRRALVFDVRLAPDGEIVSTAIVRARIRSRAKLSFEDVQLLYDDPARATIASRRVVESLLRLREVGEARIAVAAKDGVVRYRRRETEVKIGAGRVGFMVLEAVRDPVELFNEQISLLCNREAGRLLAESAAPHLQPIYRVHPSPDPTRLQAFAALTRAVAEAHGLDPARVGIGDREPLAAYLERLAAAGPADRITRAIERQAVLINVRSEFTTEPSHHFGVGAEVYARASAPMREVVGVFLHKELVELLSGVPQAASSVDEALRARVVEAGNEARTRQRRVNDLVNRLVIDRILGDDAGRGGPARPGTVMGITSSRIHVELDDPGLDVKVYLRDLGAFLGGAWLEVDPTGAVLRRKEGGGVVARLGDRVDVIVMNRDTKRDRWRLGIRRSATSG
jgi:ribonuclease R